MHDERHCLSDFLDFQNTSARTSWTRWLRVKETDSGVSLPSRYSAPSYLDDILHRAADVDDRSANTESLMVQSTRRSTLDDRAFPVTAATAWNRLYRRRSTLQRRRLHSVSNWNFGLISTDHHSLTAVPEHPVTLQSDPVIFYFNVEHHYNESILNNNNKAIVDIRLRPSAALGEPFWVYALLASSLPGRLWANMTSSTKPEVHNVLHCRQMRTEARPQLTCVQKNSWSLDMWFFSQSVY